MKLTKRSIDDLIPSDRVDLFWDEELAGFGVRVSPGGTKAFVVQFRDGTVTKRRTLGSVKTLALDRARNAAKDVLAAVRLGEVLPLKKGDGPPLNDVLDRFLAFTEAKRSPRTASDYRTRIDGHIRPEFGSKRINRITRAEIEAWHEGKAGTPRTANYLLTILVAAFSYAVRMKIITDAEHPARGIPKYPENKRTRYLSLEEIGRLGKALNELEADKKVSPWAAAALRLLVLTGMRHGEVLGLKWGYVDLERSELHLPTSKTGAKTVKLSGAAARVIARIPKIEGNEWVIAGKRHGEHMMSLQRPWEEVLAASGLTAVRIHDLRHSAASVATSGGIGLAVVGSLLGQSQAYTTQRYSHIHDAAERHAAEVIADQVAPLLAAPKRQTRKK
jgi:integrase